MLPAQASAKGSAETNPAKNPEIELANVLFRYSPGLAVNIVGLRGQIVPTPGHNVATFNDPSSFAMASDAAEVHMSMAQMSALMNDWLLRSPKAQLKNVRVKAEGEQLVIHGTMKKGLSIPFTSKAKPGISGDNRMQFTVEQAKAGGLPVKGLLDALGLSMEDLVSQKGLNGISVDGNSFLIDPQTALPAPHIRAKLTGVRIQGQNLVILFGKGAPKLPPSPWKNYMSVHGGDVEYGRDEMFNADLTMIDSTPADPFEFYLAKYWCQMAGASIKAQPDMGFRVVMPDYSKLAKGSCR